jgi:CRISPR-associated endonuclease/helicase Cas3
MTEHRTEQSVPRETIAHARRDESSRWLTHRVDDHLTGTAQKASQFGRVFGAADWAEIAGLWHDLGKYKPEFQDYIRNVTGYDTEAHLETVRGKVDHSTAGAVHAIQRHPGVGRLLAYLIAGHHAGLADWWGELEGRVRNVEHLADARKGALPQTLLDAALPTTKPGTDPDHAHLWLRMLFSCLVDADFLDTEAFMSPTNVALRSSAVKVGELEATLSVWMKKRDDQLVERGTSDSPVNRVRREVLGDCVRASDSAPGFFSLSVPTGGGKTLSSLAFALAHARKREKRRVIVVIPYTSIIEQTAQVLKDIFGADNVLEHHSNLDPERETTRGRLAAENWEAPIVVTTNVQLFESLFASRTSRCRKLHNVAESVVVLDEAQMLPPDKLMPTLSVLKGLVAHFGCSVVLCTATQPRLTGEIGSGEAKFRGLDKVHPIIADPEALARRLRRVELREHGEAFKDWTTLAQEIAQFPQVLTIVNRRQDCRDLWESLKAVTVETPVHLSALMCGEHRSQVICQLKESLRIGVPLRVVSTQLVEAGVDIDFPVVYRAMAGLDSLGQAAGRCNREGRLNLEGKLGQVVVFNPPKPSPPGLLRKGEDTAREILRTMPDEATKLSPKAFDAYFSAFYQRANDLGKAEFHSLLVKNAAKCEFQFRTASEWYQLIDDKGTRSIFVWYQSERFDSRKLLEDIKYVGPSRTLMRRLQRCTVNVPVRAFNTLREQGAIQEVMGPEGPMGLFGQCVPGLYDSTFGLRLEGPELSGMEFVC